MAIVDELIAILGFDIRGEEKAAAFEKRMDNLNKSVGKFATNIGRVAGFAAGAGAAAFGLLGKSVITTSAEFERYEAILTTIEGTQEQAKASLDFISDFAKKTPFEVAQLTDAFVKLKAYGIDPIANDTMTVLGDTASAMGKTLEQAVEAFADASTGEFERLKEFGIKAKTAGDNVTFAWTKNGKELTKTVHKNGEEIRGFLLETFGSKFTGAMERQSKTFNGMVSNLADGWTDFKRRIGDAGFFEVVNKSLRSLLDRIQFLDDTGRLDEWAKSISDALTSAWKTAEYVIGRMIAIGGYLAEVYTAHPEVFAAIGVALALLAARAFPLITIMTLLGVVVDDFVSFMQGGQSVIGDFSQSLQDMLGIGEGLADTIASWGAGIATALAGVFLIAPGTVTKIFGKLLFKGIVSLAPLLASAVGLLFTPVGWVVLAVAAASALVYYFWDEIKAGFAAWKKWWSDLGASIGTTLMEINWSDLGSQMMNAMFNGMKSIGGAIRDWFSGLIPDWAKNYFTSKSEPTRDASVATQRDVDESQVFNQPVAPSRTRSQLSEQGSQTAGATGDQLAKLEAIAANWKANSEAMMNDKSVEATINDGRQDNRHFNSPTTVTVYQTVTKASDAPKQAAQATGNAAAQAVAAQRGQLNESPSF